jgi:hypothetical protein
VERRRAQGAARALPGRATLGPKARRGSELATSKKGKYVLRRAKRKDLPPLPDFHALRRAAVMHCEDAEDARDLLRHNNSNVTLRDLPRPLQR